MVFSRFFAVSALSLALFSSLAVAAPTGTESSLEIEARDGYSACVRACIDSFGEGPNRNACWKRCKDMYGSMANSRKPVRGKKRSLEEIEPVAREIVERDYSEVTSLLEVRDGYSACVRACIDSFGEGPNRNACWKRCKDMYGSMANSRKPVRGKKRSLEEIEPVAREIVERDSSEVASLLEARDGYSACVRACIDSFGEGPNRNACWKRCKDMYGSMANSRKPVRGKKRSFDSESLEELE